jgi:tRNA threonylcarbamoyladenosine biosynthesis protein TsaB
MPSLSQILRAHSPLLLIDASSETVQVGLLSADGEPHWASRCAEAGVGIFECLDDLDLEIAEVASFAYCEGPGSILGIRSSAMALRAWNAITPRPMYAYIGLALVAESLGRPLATLIADARRGQWHRLRRGSPLERVAAAELSGELVMPEGFRHWDPLPFGTTRTPYSVASMLALPEVASAALFRETAAPDAFLHGEPSYVRWAPKIHRAP